jgi:hypothetical protein
VRPEPRRDGQHDVHLPHMSNARATPRQ